mmetsp:Transcript_5288/g.15250  ORF Transcript_5288/g.15250 Transcript_5288/m.15250 type:complete len:234 (-) Transcript_5288:139-840(-)
MVWRRALGALFVVHASANPFRVKIDVENLDGGGDGSFVLDVFPSWAPRGAARFEELVNASFFDGVRFFRVIDGFMAQFGISGDPAVSAEWRDKTLEDDAVLKRNSRGTLSYATAGPNTRTTQVFVNFKDNTFLDGQGFAPFARVSSGMDVVDRLYAGYGEGAPSGKGPSQGAIESQGNAYLDAEFPRLSRIRGASVLEGGPPMNAEVDAASPRHSLGLCGPLLAVAMCAAMGS